MIKGLLWAAVFPCTSWRGHNGISAELREPQQKLGEKVFMKRTGRFLVALVFILSAVFAAEAAMSDGDFLKLCGNNSVEDAQGYQ